MTQDQLSLAVMIGMWGPVIAAFAMVVAVGIFSSVLAVLARLLQASADAAAAVEAQKRRVIRDEHVRKYGDQVNAGNRNAAFEMLYLHGEDFDPREWGKRD